jgi:hypothetical protein
MNRKIFSAKPKEIFGHFRRESRHILLGKTYHYHPSHLFGVDPQIVSKISAGHITIYILPKSKTGTVTGTVTFLSREMFASPEIDPPRR